MSIDNNANISEGKISIAVLKEYDAVPSGISLIQGGTIKTVWRIGTGKGSLCLKRLKQPYDKALFSVNAQIYIKNSGGNVPGIISNKKGEAITEYNGQLFVLYEWIEGTGLDFNNPSDLKNALLGLALFHNFSKGYVPADGSKISSKLGKWPEQYESMLSRLDSWVEIAKAKVSQPNFSTYGKLTASVVDIGRMALKEIKTSAYEELSAVGSNSIVLCHQDYGKGNALLTDKGVYVLDLDGVTFELPARDLRKIIGKAAENKNNWQMEKINEIVNWYEQGSPMSKAEKKILYIDLLFPHWYYGLVKNLFQAGKPVKAFEIERIAMLELSKIPLLKTLLRRSE